MQIILAISIRAMIEEVMKLLKNCIIQLICNHKKWNFMSLLLFLKYL